MQGLIEEKLLRIHRQMSPTKESYPLGTRPWEESLRSYFPKPIYSDYYILNSPGTFSTRHKSYSVKERSEISKESWGTDRKPNSKLLFSSLRSDLMATAYSKHLDQTLTASPKRDSKDLNKRILNLETENQKYIDLCNAELNRHQLEKKKWTENSIILKEDIEKNSILNEFQELKIENAKLKLDFNIYQHEQENLVFGLRNENSKLRRRVCELESELNFQP